MNMDLELPGGVITTHCVSTVIRPGSKVTHDPLQFVKIQSAELSKKAVEQIRLAEEVKITKDKIKEVEEEWQNNLLNWKSKRRQSRTPNCSLNDEESDHLDHHHHHHHHHSLYDSDNGNNRKIKTFSEILNEKAKSGYRIGYNLHKYIRNGSEDDDEEEEEDEDEGCKMEDDNTSRLSSSSCDSSSKKMINETATNQTPMATSSSTGTIDRKTIAATNNSLSGSLLVDDDNDDNPNADGDDDDENDGDDEATHDSVDDRSSSSASSSGMVKNDSNDLEKRLVDKESELIDQQQQQQQLNDKQEIKINLNNINNSHNLDHHKNQQQQRQQQQQNEQKDQQKSSLKPSRIVKPGMINKSEICRINSYTDQVYNRNENVGKKVILKYKIEKDVGRQSSLPLSSSIPSSTAYCDKETLSTWSSTSSSDNEMVKRLDVTVHQENEPRLSFRDKLSNFENLSKGEDIGSSSHHHPHHPHHTIQHSNQNHSHHHSHQKERKLNNLTESTSSLSSSQTRISGQASTTSTLSSLPHHDDQIKNQSTEIIGSDCESNSTGGLDLSSKQKPALPPRPVIGERKSLPVDNHNKLHQNVSRTSSDSSVTAPSDNNANKINNNYFRFTTKPYTNPRVIKSNGSKPVVCHQGSSLPSITASSLPSPSSASTASVSSSSASSLSPFQQMNSTGPDNIIKFNHNNGIGNTSNEENNENENNSRISSTYSSDEPSVTSNDNINTAVSTNSSSSMPTTSTNVVSTPPPTTDVTTVNGLTKASFKHLSLSPQTSNSSVSSYNINGNRTGSPLITATSITTNTIPDSFGRSLSMVSTTSSPSLSSSSSHQGSPQIIDIRTSNGTGSCNGQGDGESKRSNYPNILISPFKVHRPIINSFSSENLSNSQRCSPSTFTSLGEKARSEVQLIKKSNENLKSLHDQRSMLSISGKKKCSNCGDELGRGCAAMVIETLSLYYHINCFRCSVCHIQLGNGTCGTDVRVRSHRLHCQNCYSNDEVGLTRV